MSDEQRQLAREVGEIADRLTREPVVGFGAKTGDEVVLDDGTRVVLAEDSDNFKGAVEVRVYLRPELAAWIADSSRYGPPPQACFETPGITIEGNEP